VCVTFTQDDVKLDIKRLFLQYYTQLSNKFIVQTPFPTELVRVHTHTYTHTHTQTDTHTQHSMHTTESVLPLNQINNKKRKAQSKPMNNNKGISHTHRPVKRLKPSKPETKTTTQSSESANVASALGQVQASLVYAKKALDIARKRYGNKPHASIATALNNLGEAYRKLGEFTHAKMCYTQALAMDRILYENQPHENITISLNNLGIVCNALKELAQAKTYPCASENVSFCFAIASL